MNVAKGFAIRAGEGAIQVRITDHSWSLPTGVEGAIAISVGDLRQALDIDDNTDTMVNAGIERVDAVKLLDAMDKASVLTFTVGKAKPVAVSLAGSMIVTNAFRTCAGLRGSTAAPGGNPFE
jgi:hypothetical protein